MLPILVSKYSFSIKMTGSTFCTDFCCLSFKWIVTATQGLLACFPCLTLDPPIPVQELGFQTVLGRAIPGQERTNWEHLLSNETINQTGVKTEVSLWKINDSNSKKIEKINQTLVIVPGTLVLRDMTMSYLHVLNKTFIFIYLLFSFFIDQLFNNT